MRRSRNLKFLLFFIGVVLLVLAFPLPRTGNEGVHPALAGVHSRAKILVQPYLDDGKIEVGCLNPDGSTKHFVFLVDDGPECSVRKFHVGEMDVGLKDDPSTSLLDNRSREFVCNLLEFKLPASPDSMVARIYLRGAPRDYIAYLIFKSAQRFQEMIQSCLGI